MELMHKTPSARFFVKDHSFVGAARREVRRLAERAGLSGEPLSRIDLLATELATNLAKHANGGGELLVFDGSINGMENTIHLLSLDRGPGMADLEAMLVDGVSTKGTLGGGLGAIQRLSDCFEFDSVPDKGTVVLSTVSQKRNSNQKLEQDIEVGAISVPHFAEERCGDGVSVVSSSEMTSILVVDGLGHGDGAADAAEYAIEEFAAKPFDDPVKIVDTIHCRLKDSRGAAVALVQIDQINDVLNFAGVGNITSRIYSRCSSKGCVSVQGIVGGNMCSSRLYTYPWEAGSCLLMHSDGIKSSATLTNLPPKSALLKAAILYRDFCRTTDDTTVVVVKDKRRV